jgi:hypothetical protein
VPPAPPRMSGAHHQCFASREDFPCPLPRPLPPLPSQTQAAELMQVSREQVQKARRVEREAPQLLEPIRSGEMTINAALEKVKEKKPSRR